MLRRWNAGEIWRASPDGGGREDVVFKRRNKRSWQAVLRDSLWPRGGWGRAFTYIRHRLNRLPDPPHRIARGIFIGIFVSFTPLFGIHLIVAAVLAKLFRGNVLASLFATVIGNPLTFPLIALSAIKLGHWMTWESYDASHAEGLLDIFAQAFVDTRHNLIAIFTSAPTQWSGMSEFFYDIFLPYLLGGVVMGTVAGAIGYYIALPLVTAYQKARKLRLKARLAKLKAKLPQRKTVEAEPVECAPEGALVAPQKIQSNEAVENNDKTDHEPGRG
ncbi:hypothetical protein C8J27_10231 [Rhodobacter aestuarii]|uniref:DUF2062 domain-containing protein n=1 Tax=Rhodobacter aestuarii TaxID=453582 RepID=A0A1N7N4T6_9RHOB|nr:hypothetical protein C8J27_10231 [Rhodobacter aestuarii]SIS93365.1 hypothetical protein SAMN05421580_10731 [Rhodobacter aestuarii]